jgi:hypothetical protein
LRIVTDRTIAANGTLYFATMFDLFAIAKPN